VRRGQVHHVSNLSLERRESSPKRRGRVLPFFALEFRQGDRNHAPHPIGREQIAKAAEHTPLELAARHPESARTDVGAAVAMPRAAERLAARYAAEGAAAGPAAQQARESVPRGPTPGRADALAPVERLHVAETSAAARIYNELAEQGEAVGGLFHSTC
jgi:hypothetical protein